MSPKTRTTSPGAASLTPLLDTLFILLFSLLALSDSRSVESSEVVRVELPGVEPNEQSSARQGLRLSIEIDADSAVRWKGDDRVITTWDQLDTVLAAKLEGRDPAETTVELEADRDARHGVAVSLLQHLRVNGFTNVELIAVELEASSLRIGGTR